ncbi:MAG: hypothetical protein WBR26_13215 [Candidatus Acidiferrum sp.]
MKRLPKDVTVNCEWFLNELEGLPNDAPRGVTAELLRVELPDAAREHASRCAKCEAALQDFAETRRALEGMAELLPQAGPWFAPRVMQRIASAEQEIEERQDGFWIGVRRLAPRLVAFALLLLMLGGTWAFEETRAARTKKSQTPSIEGIFENAPSTPANDDVIATSFREQP